MTQEKDKKKTSPVTFIESPSSNILGDLKPEQSEWDEEILNENPSDENLSEDLGGAPEEAVDEALEDWKPDFSEQETDDQMKKLSSAVSQQTQKDCANLERIVAAGGMNAEDLQTDLEQQIAEDVALEAELQQESELTTDELTEIEQALPHLNASGELDLVELQSCIETLLFLSDRPLSLKKIKEYLGPDFEDDLFKSGISALKERYSAPVHGFELLEIAGGYQLRTKPGRAALAKKLSKIQTQRLSRGAMESLAIVAYKQPILKDDIDKIRGVDSSHFIRTLLDKKLIEISGRSELPGRPIIYQTSQNFLEIFGLNDLSAMPSLREIEQMVPASQTDNPNDPAQEDPRIRNLRKMVEQMKEENANLKYNPKEDEKILQEIKERVESIPTSTPYIDEQKMLVKQASLEAQGLLDPTAANQFAEATETEVSEAAPSGDESRPLPEAAEPPHNEEIQNG